MKKALFASILGLGLCFVAPAIAQEQQQESGTMGQFRAIEQPLWLKGLVTVGGLTLLGLELWWFLGSNSKPKQDG